MGSFFYIIAGIIGFLSCGACVLFLQKIKASRAKDVQAISQKVLEIAQDNQTHIDLYYLWREMRGIKVTQTKHISITGKKSFQWKVVCEDSQIRCSYRFFRATVLAQSQQNNRLTYRLVKKLPASLQRVRFDEYLVLN